MAAELLAGAAQLRFLPFDTQGSQQFCPGLAGEVVQFAAAYGVALVIGKVTDRQSRRDDAKPLVESGKLAQERLQGRLPQPPFLWTGWILERLQTVQHQ